MRASEVLTSGQSTAEPVTISYSTATFVDLECLFRKANKILKKNLRHKFYVFPSRLLERLWIYENIDHTRFLRSLYT